MKKLIVADSVNIILKISVWFMKETIFMSFDMYIY